MPQMTEKERTDAILGITKSMIDDVCLDGRIKEALVRLLRGDSPTDLPRSEVFDAASWLANLIFYCSPRARWMEKVLKNLLYQAAEFLDEPSLTNRLELTIVDGYEEIHDDIASD